jgi:hypothetical protein
MTHANVNSSSSTPSSASTFKTSFPAFEGFQNDTTSTRFSKMSLQNTSATPAISAAAKDNTTAEQYVDNASYDHIKDGEAPDADAPLTLRALVSTKEAGVIIGKAGKNVADLRDQTGVKAGVSKVVQGVHDRVLTVTGTIEGVAKVRTERREKTGCGKQLTKKRSIAQRHDDCDSMSVIAW